MAVVGKVAADQGWLLGGVPRSLMTNTSLHASSLEVLRLSAGIIEY